MAVIGRGAAHEIVVVDKDIGRVRGLVTDMQYGTPLCPPVRLVGGDFADLEGAELVLIAVGINEKAGGAMDRSDPAGRLRLLGTNAQIIREVVPKIMKAAPTALMMVITNPPEPLAALAREIAGHDQVISSGTYIDTLRFRFYIAKQLQVNPSEISAYVVGEHGNSRVLLWSSARVANTPVMDLLPAEDIPDFKSRVEDQVRNANITIIEGINASQYGIGIACGRIVEAMTRNEHAVFPVGYHSPHYGTTLSMPVVIGRKGVERVLIPSMAPDELAALQRSADTMHAAMKKI